MQAALRPMNLGEILDRTFGIYRKKFLVFAGIALLPAAIMLAIHGLDIAWVHTDRWIDHPNQGARFVGSWFLAYAYYHISGFVWVLIQPAFVRGVSGVLFDESISILGSLRSVGRRWRTYLWLAFLKICAQLVVPELIAFALLFGYSELLGAMGVRILDVANLIIVPTLFVIAGIFVAFFWIGVSLAFAIPAAALEEMSGWKALRRSCKLTKGSRGRIFVAWIMVIACSLVLEGVAALLAWWIATLIYTGHHAPGFNRQAYEVVIYFFYAVVGAVVGPLYPIAATLFYYDQRSRKEGFDVEIMMEAAGLTAPAAVASPAAARVETASEPATGGADG